MGITGKSFSGLESILKRVETGMSTKSDADFLREVIRELKNRVVYCEEVIATLEDALFYRSHENRYPTGD